MREGPSSIASPPGMTRYCFKLLPTPPRDPSVRTRTRMRAGMRWDESMHAAGRDAARAVSCSVRQHVVALARKLRWAQRALPACQERS